MRAKRTDTTQRGIFAALRAKGWLVFDTSGLERWIDGVAFHPATEQWMLVECKTGNAKLTESQQRMIDNGWRVTILGNYILDKPKPTR